MRNIKDKNRNTINTISNINANINKNIDINKDTDKIQYGKNQYEQNLYEQIQIDLGTTLAYSLEDKLYLDELKQRKLFLCDIISDETVIPIIKTILQFNTEDKENNIPIEQRKPILLYLNTLGGEVSAGNSLIDVIMQSKTPVWSICYGTAYSMGFLIMLAAEKRIGTKMSTYLMHEGSVGIIDNSGKANDTMKFNQAVEKRVKEYVLSRTLFTAREYDKNHRIELYLFANQAKEKGVLTDIIGETISLDDII